MLGYLSKAPLLGHDLQPQGFEHVLSLDRESIIGVIVEDYQYSTAMTFSTTLEKFDQGVWGYHFPISMDITEKMSSDSHRRVICHVNGMVKMYSCLMPFNGASYIMINQTNRKKLGIKVGQSVELTLLKDNSEYGMPMPETLMVLLDQDEVGSKYFHALTPGKQRSLMYIVSKVKSIDKQISKGLAILEHLKDVHGKLDPQMLAEKIKQYNQINHPL